MPVDYWRGSGRRRRRAHGGSRAGRWIVSSCHAALLYGRQIEGSIVNRTVRAGWIEDSNGRGRPQLACLPVAAFTALKSELNGMVGLMSPVAACICSLCVRV